jgi:hypothetical protein
MGFTERQAHFLALHSGYCLRRPIELPDVRIEYEDRDGVAQQRDLEPATEQYSRSQLSGKQSAGFRVYRAVAARGASAGGTGWDAK